jgi:hypothetical protein
LFVSLQQDGSALEVSPTKVREVSSRDSQSTERFVMTSYDQDRDLQNVSHLQTRYVVTSYDQDRDLQNVSHLQTRFVVTSYDQDRDLQNVSHLQTRFLALNLILIPHTQFHYKASYGDMFRNIFCHHQA